MIRLTRLKVEGCRGIKDGPDLNFAEGGLILQGDNGVGKSSYIDALEKVLTGSCSTVESGDQGISWTRYGQNVAADKCYVGLTVTDGGKNYNFEFDGKSCKSPKLGSFVSAVKQKSFLLRRRILLSFIDCKPSERYQALEGFLNLSTFEAFERGLKAVKAAEEGKVSAKSSEMQILEQEVRAALGIAPNDPVDLERCITAVNLKLTAASLTGIASVETAMVRLGEVEARIASFSNVEELGNLTALARRLQNPPSEELVSKQLRDLIATKEALLTEEHKLKGSFFEEVLKKGLEWIVADELTSCPLCRNTISIAEISDSIERRLSENKVILDLRADVVRLSKALEVSARSAAAELGALGEAILAPLERNRYRALASVQEVLVGITLLGEAADVGDLRAMAESLDRSASQSDVAALAQSVDAALTGRANEKEIYDALASASGALRCFCRVYPEVEGLRRGLTDAKSRAEDVARVCTCAEAARKFVVAAVVAQVADLADAYFRRIHPDEKIGSPCLEIAKVGTASIKLTSAFHAKVGDPRGLYSEGHIDSLGLCLFLAIRKLHWEQCPELSILVLDDVLHSVDGDHRQRTAQLIFEEFGNHQLIITTHDPIWYRYLCQRAQKSGRRFTMHRIGAWSLEEGPKWGDHLADFEWLLLPVGSLAPPKDRAAKAGRLLEELLFHCCDRTQTAVPFRMKGDYTIDPLWVAFHKKAKMHRGFSQIAASALDEIEITRELRNFGAHWSQWSQLLTDKEAERFVNAVLRFRSLVFCDKCLAFMKEFGELEDLWCCRGQHLAYPMKDRGQVASP